MKQPQSITHLCAASMKRRVLSGLSLAMIWLAGTMNVQGQIYVQSQNVFQKTYTGPTGFSDVAINEFEPGFIFTGVVDAGASVDPYMIKTDYDGQKIWYNSYGNAFPDGASGVTWNVDNELALTGHRDQGSSGSALEEQVLTHKTTGNGGSTWTRAVGDTKSEIGRAIDNYWSPGTQSIIDGFVTVGEVDLGSTQEKAVVTHLKGDGSLMYNKHFTFSSGPAGATDIDIPNNTFDLFVAVNVKGSFAYPAVMNLDLFTAGINWSRGLGGDGFDNAKIVATRYVQYDNTVLMVGTTALVSGNSDIFVAKLKADGTGYNWAVTYDIGGVDVAAGVAVNADGTIVIGGNSDAAGPGSQNGFLMKITNNGYPIFTTGYGGVGNHTFNALNNAPNGGVIAVGASDGLGWAVKVDQNGYSGCNDYELNPVRTAKSPTYYAALATSEDVNVMGIQTAAATSRDLTENTECCGAAFVSTNQGPVRTQYQSYISHAENHHATGIAIQDNGSILLAGPRIAGGTNKQIHIVSTNSSGTYSWSHLYSQENLNEYPHDMIKLSEECPAYATAGYYEYGGIRYPMLMKFGNNGDLQWSHGYGGNRDAEAFDIEEVDGGDMAMVGYTKENRSRRSDILFLRTKSFGSFDFGRAIGTNANEIGHALKQTDDGGYIIVGQTDNTAGAGGEDVYLVKLSASGAVQWTRIFGNNRDDIGKDVEIDAAGNYIITGTSTFSGVQGVDIFLAKVNPSGTLLGFSTFGGTGTEDVNHIMKTENGNYYLLGKTDSYGPDDDALILEVTSNGQLLNARRYGKEFDQEFYKGVQKSSDILHVAGRTNGTSSGDDAMYSLKLKNLKSSCLDYEVLPSVLSLEVSVSSGGDKIDLDNGVISLFTSSKKSDADDKQLCRDPKPTKQAEGDSGAIEDAVEEALTLYPNPTKGTLNLRYDFTDAGSIAIYDLSGRHLRSFATKASPEIQIDLNNLKAGVYIVQISQKEGTVLRKKFVVMD